LSDLRHKKNVEPLTAGLKEVELLKPVTFEWKKLSDKGMEGQQVGFIAQDVEKVLPAVVVTADNAEKTKSIKYDEIIPVLTKAIQELKADNDKLRTEFEVYKTAHP
jgi:DNA recombination-dependent growth factor C